MGKLIYEMNVSLDGYVETVDKDLGWGIVDEELHSWFADQTRTLDASIYGRGMYETMAPYWPTAASDPDATPAMIDFANAWGPMPKIVFSSSLESVAWNSRLVAGDVAEELARIRKEFDGDIDVGGATLAHSFIERGLVDDFRLVVHPVVLGAGTPYFPRLERPIGLRLTDTKRFDSGVIYVGYERI
jgi:dihydrofolate reductase